MDAVSTSVFSRATSSNSQQLSGLMFIIYFYIRNHKFETELFVTDIEARPPTWDSTAASYDDKVEKIWCWETLCPKMFPDFQAKTLAQRNEFCKE